MRTLEEIEKEIDQTNEEIAKLEVFKNKLVTIKDRLEADNTPVISPEIINNQQQLRKEFDAYKFVLEDKELNEDKLQAAMMLHNGNNAPKGGILPSVLYYNERY